MTAWDRVVAATDGHNIASIDVQLSGNKAWTYLRCSCIHEQPFTEDWEFTDHIRRLVFDALVNDTPR